MPSEVHYEKIIVLQAFVENLTRIAEREKQFGPDSPPDPRPGDGHEEEQARWQQIVDALDPTSFDLLYNAISDRQMRGR